MSRRPNSALGASRVSGLNVTTRSEQQTVFGTSSRESIARPVAKGLLNQSGDAYDEEVIGDVAAPPAPKGRLSHSHEALHEGMDTPIAQRTARSKLAAKAAGSAAEAVRVAALKGSRAVEPEQDVAINEQAQELTKLALKRASPSSLHRLPRVGGRARRRAERLSVNKSASAVLGRSTAYGRRSASHAANVRSRTMHTGVRRVTSGAAMSVRRVAQSVVSVGKLVMAGAAALAASPILGISTVVLGIIAVVLTIFPWLGGVAAHESEQAATSSDFTPGQVGDDYPYKDQPYDEMSPLRYAYGNCTDFVAWRINRDLGQTKEPWKVDWGDLTPHGGDGKDWANPDNLPGWEITDSPSPGDIFSVPANTAAWGSSAGNGYGHVGYVGAVYADGTILLENYGHNKYYTFTKTTAEAKADSAAGLVTFRANPNKQKRGPSGGGNDQTLIRASPEQAKRQAYRRMLEHGWSTVEDAQCLEELWNGESNWRWDAENPSSGAYGIPQALPGDKMKDVGEDWKTNADTQIRWGLQYIKERYGSPCEALDFWKSNDPHWY